MLCFSHSYSSHLAEGASQHILSSDGLYACFCTPETSACGAVRPPTPPVPPRFLQGTAADVADGAADHLLPPPAVVAVIVNEALLDSKTARHKRSKK